MRNGDQRAVVMNKKILQPVNGFKIKIVCRLVQQQRRRIAEKRLGQKNAHFLASLQFTHHAVVQGFRNVQTVQQNGRVAFRRVAVFFGNGPFQLAQPHAVFISQFGFGVKNFAFFQGLPKRLIAHNDGVNNAKRVKQILVLTQNPDFFGPHHVALLRLVFTGEKLHKCRLAGAVRTRQPVSAFIQKRSGDIFK